MLTAFVCSCKVKVGRGAMCQKKQKNSSDQRASVTGYKYYLVAGGHSSLVEP